MYIKTRQPGRTLAVLRQKSSSNVHVLIKSEYQNQQPRTYSATIEPAEMVKLADHLLEILPQKDRIKLIRRYVKVKTMIK